MEQHLLPHYVKVPTTDSSVVANKDAQADMRQIDRKAYAKKYSLEDVDVVKVGVNFDPEQRNLTDWVIEKL